MIDFVAEVLKYEKRVGRLPNLITVPEEHLLENPQISKVWLSFRYNAYYFDFRKDSIRVVVQKNKQDSTNCVCGAYKSGAWGHYDWCNIKNEPKYVLNIKEKM